jgi:pSer/pThr/pTyr-binding forkhead associated (FHA) protein/prolyl-tRNA editing enzyme YbaK/EbsC (Cys-tRNA(Pro) deacylase)
MAQQNTIGYLHSADPLLLQAEYPVTSAGLRIGREAERCQVILCRDTVSRQHCHIEVRNEGAVLVDLDSTNGTYVNGAKIKRHALQNGDIISLGKDNARHFVFSTGDAATCDEYALAEQSLCLIGRLADNDIALSNDPTVSAHHARLRCRGTEVVAEDLGSANGTFVNGERITRKKVRPQDVLRIGFTELCVVSEGGGLRISRHNKQNRLQLQAVRLGRHHKHLQLLRNINLVIEPGEYVGVLGPSGAGKSTLLTALSGFQPAGSGAVLLNGTSLYRCYDMFRHAIGYVPQDDIIHRDLSVERSLAYTAQGVAALAHVSGKKLAKTVILKVDGVLAMVVVPASSHVDLDRVRALTGGHLVEIASEGEFQNAFPDCELGAMPPFGNLYDMPVYADESLADNEEITFSAGTHRELVRISWQDMLRLVHPTVAELTYHRLAAA